VARRLYRVYYTTYSDEKHRRVVEALKSELGAEVVDHPSRVLPEFRFVEVLKPEPGLEGRIRGIVERVLGEREGEVKVDWIDTSS
jgi:hypothetical protein